MESKLSNILGVRLFGAILSMIKLSVLNSPEIWIIWNALLNFVACFLLYFW